MAAEGGEAAIKDVGDGEAEKAVAVPNPTPHPKNTDDILKASMRRGKAEGDKLDETDDPLQRIAFSADEEFHVFPGYFSWLSAFFMCVFIVLGFSSLVFTVLSLRQAAIPMVATEISYINAENPPWKVAPWGYVKQPNDATERRIGQPFTYAMPQTIIYYSICCASFGIFTVAYFCSELLVQDLGVQRVMQMGDVINRGVDVYVSHTMPIMFAVMTMVGSLLIYFTDFTFLISMSVGALSCLMCSNLGTSMNFKGAPRLCNSLNYDLVGSMQMAIRIGAIGGLGAHSMAQLGVVFVWITLRTAESLVGFGCGVAIVAFYNRIGGGIFAKGSDIGSDFVSEMMGEDVDDYNMDFQDALKAEFLEDKDGDGEIDDDAAIKRQMLDPNAHIHEEQVGFITKKEAQLRDQIEKAMEKALHDMHPVNYLDAIGENIADVGGTSSDLFETMCITLASSVVLGSKAHEVPYLGTSLPFNIISTGTLGCSIVSYYVWTHDRHPPWLRDISHRLNLLAVMLFVQTIVCVATYLHYSWWKTITFERMVNYDVIVWLGLCSPEICATICEFFTSVNCPPVANLAKDADLGMIQVVLQGLGQGFVSAFAPSSVNIVVQILAFHLEKFYGLVLLACASQACTGWQATLASYGAVANNANRFVHLTTVNEMAHHRANLLASIGTTTSHTGKVVAGQNAFFATTTLLGALLADKYTKEGLDWQNTVGQELSEFTRAGLLAGIGFTMLFLANTLTSCIEMAKKLVTYCDGNTEVLPRLDKKFPATHIKPLKALVSFSAIQSMQLCFSPLLNSFAAPFVIGQLFGFKGLLMLVSGANSVCFTLNMFLVNTGQAWDAARKYVLFGMLKDAKGNVIGAESELYDHLGIGEQIGGPLEDLTGPALNNFIKLVAVVSFVTSRLYDQTPENTYVWGIGQVFINFSLIYFFKYGVQKVVDAINDFLRKQQEAIDYEEGKQLLKAIEAKEKELAALAKDEEERAANGPALISANPGM